MSMVPFTRGKPHEGNGAARILRLMREQGYNEGHVIAVAEVRQVEPSVAIRLHGDPFDLTEEQGLIHVLEHLKEKTYSMSINGAPKVPVVVDSPLKVGDNVVVVVSESQQTYYVLGTI